MQCFDLSEAEGSFSRVFVVSPVELKRPENILFTRIRLRIFDESTKSSPRNPDAPIVDEQFCFPLLTNLHLASWSRPPRYLSVSSSESFLWHSGEGHQ